MGQFTRNFLSKKLTTGLESAVVDAPLAEGAVTVDETVAVPAPTDVPVVDAPIVPAVEDAGDDEAEEKAEPVEPAEATDVEDDAPEAATEPAEPTEPVEPAEPTEPVEPAAVEPEAEVEETPEVVEPIEPADSVEPVPTEVQVVPEAAAEPVVLEDEYADAIVAANTAEVEVEEAESDVDSLEEVTEGLEAIRATLQRTLLAGGARGTELQLAQIGVESYCARVPGLKPVSAGLEAADLGVTTGRILATNQGLEALSDTLKNAYEIAKKALMALFEQIKAFVLKVFDYLERLKSRLEKAKERLKGISGSAKESTVELSSDQLAAISNDGSVAKAADYLKSSAKFFNTLATKFTPKDFLGRSILTIYTQGALDLFTAKDQAATDAAHDKIDKMGAEFLTQLGQMIDREDQNHGTVFYAPRLIGGNNYVLEFAKADTFIDQLAGSSVRVSVDDGTLADKAQTLSVTEIKAVLEAVETAIDAVEYYRSRWFGGLASPESVWIAEINSSSSKVDSAIANMFTSDPRTKKFVSARPKLVRLVQVGPTKVLAVLRKAADAALVYAEKSMDQYGAAEAPAKAE